MERKDFLKGIGLAGAAAMLPLSKTAKADVLKTEEEFFDTCTLIPTETRGPYPLPATTNVSVITKSDIRESKTGVLLTLTITVQNLSCTPVPNARVDIWHCDKDGYYSAYNNQPGYLGTQNNSGSNWLRGSQTTDSNGEVTFTSIYPGWYTGRVTHIHAEVYIGGVLQRTSQFAFPDSLNTTVYTASALYTPHGTNSITNSTDNVFSDGYSEQLLTISGSVAAGYVASHTFTVNYTILPLTLLSFNAGFEKGNVMLWWSTGKELSVSRFEIERSNNSINFVSLGSVTAKNGSGTNSYVFTDSSAQNGNAFYRLKMIDNNGDYTYSSIILLNSKTMQGISLSPNPAKEKIILSHPKANSGAFVEILDMQGQSVATGVLNPGATTTSIDISMLNKGMYLLIVNNTTGKQVIKFLKN